MASFSVKQTVTLIRDGILVFSVSTIACAAVGLLSASHLLDVHRLGSRPTWGSSSSLEGDLIAAIRESFKVRSDSLSPANNAALAEHNLSRDEHIQFVSDIIRSHVAGDENDFDALATLIVDESSRQQYDPILVAAVVRSESSFDQEAVSHAGARGLMQIMPATGRHLSNAENIPWNGTDTLHDPESNLRLGIAYLKQLESKFKGDRERALIAYNWGPTNVEQALRSRRAPPKQSISYARSIISAHRKWQRSFSDRAVAGENSTNTLG